MIVVSQFVQSMLGDNPDNPEVIYIITIFERFINGFSSVEILNSMI